MPPKKNYLFINELNYEIQLSIRAYSKDEAIDILVFTVKNPEDFKLKA